MDGLQTEQVLAPIRLRELQREKVALKPGKVTKYNARGRPRKNGGKNQYDAALVRVCDFDLAL
jgi:hypothetical protein